MPLPSPLAFLSSLFHPAPSTVSATSHTTVFSSAETKPILLTLHCLFPTDLLAALDVLDRRLITRFDPHPRPCARRGEEEEEDRGRGEEEREEKEEEEGKNKDAAAVVYYVRSLRRGRTTAGTGTGGGMNYEVRLRAWNCSCPAFAFAAFGGPRDGEEGVRWGLGGEDEDEDEDDGDSGRMEDGFGGLGLAGREVPVCKHLLACLLVELGGGLGDFVDQRVVGREEIAGWSAGWGG